MKPLYPWICVSPRARRSYQSRSFLSPSLLVGAVALACLSTHAQYAQAQPTTTATNTFTFAIPAGPLNDALDTFARQAGRSVVYDAAALAGKRSEGLKGPYRTDDGLRVLLSGSGFQARTVAGGVRIEALPAAGGISTLAPVTVQGHHETRSEGTQSYAASVATIGHTERALKDIPQSITIVTRQRMDDQNLATISDVLENTTGVTISEVGDGGRHYYSRGFKIGNIQYDGIPLARSFYAVGNSFVGSTAYLDRVEVMRGAQGLLEGAGQPGGSVNLVRKRGLAETAFNVETRAGSWDHYGTTLDAGGPLNAEGTLRARATLDYDTKHSFVDVVRERNQNAYLALDYDLTPDTTVGLGVASSHLRATPFFGGLPRYADGSSLGLKRSTFLGADWNRWERDETQVFMDLAHRFNRDWQFKVSGTYIRENSQTAISDATGAIDPITRAGAMRTAWNYDKLSRHSGLDAHVNGRFDVLGISNELTVGATMSRLKSRDQIEYASNYLPLDVFNPDSHVPKPESYPDSNRLSRYDPHTQKGVYGQLRSNVTDSLTLVLGGRFSWFESRYLTKAATWDSVIESKQSAEFTPFVGAVYALTPQWSVYASYADIFDPQTATTVNGDILKPIVGANYEAGIKGELFDGALNTSFAVYRVNQTNRAVTDYSAGPICNGNYCSRAAGKVRSQGVEAEASGELVRGLQIAAGYTYNSNKYVRDPDMQGKTFSEETPRHMLRLWSTYRLPGDWNALSVGAGVNYQSGLSNSYSGLHRGGYSVWNARVAYRFTKNWTAAVNVNNVFDKHYYEYPGYVENRNNYGTPRNVLLTLRGAF